MTVNIVRNCGDGYALFVDGTPRMVDESLGVCEAVKHALEFPELWEPTEAYEVADSIRASLEAS